MVTLALESAIETADSMRGRGFGLRGRTAFSIYRFDARDKRALLWLLACASVIAVGLATGSLHFAWYPLAYGAFGTFSRCLFAIWLALCATPLAIVLHADYRWKQIYGAMPSDERKGDSPSTASA